MMGSAVIMECSGFSQVRADREFEQRVPSLAYKRVICVTAGAVFKRCARGGKGLVGHD